MIRNFTIGFSSAQLSSRSIVGATLISLSQLSCAPDTNSGNIVIVDPDEPEEEILPDVDPSNRNVLFIMVDDLRPELNCYGQNYIKSPNIDALAAESIQFDKAYCNMPVSGASRASLLSGLYPTRDRFVAYNTKLEEDAPWAVTIPQHFKNNGYTTISYGKIFHNQYDSQEGWSESPKRFSSGAPNDYQSAVSVAEYYANSNVGPAYEAANVFDNSYIDGATADQAIAKLAELAKSDKPFLFALGFIKPHLPFNAPQKYWDMYTAADIELAPNPYIPEGAPKEAYYNSNELRTGYLGIPQGDEVLDDNLSRTLKHGYAACVSYIDAQIGRVLDALEENGLADNTIVVLLGDHGWSLGEHTYWCKHTCYNTSLNVPLLIKSPTIEPARTEAVVSYIDLYPTLCDLVGLSQPSHLQGNSLVPILNDPTITGGQVYSRYGRGEAITTEQYIYTEYINYNNVYVSRMLYDHSSDPDENVNVAEQSTYSSIATQLQSSLREFTTSINN